MKNKWLIVVPAYNEEECISDLLTVLEQYRDRFDVIVVDDGSADNTAQVVRNCGYPVLQLPANLGIGGAMQTGFKYASRYNYDVVIQIDGDGQHDPKWLDSVTQPILLNQADCVIGSRYTKEAPDLEYKTPIPRKIGMMFSTSILFFATGKKVYDTTSGFRALNRKAFDYFSKNYPVDHPEAEALFLLHRQGFRILEVPIKMCPRQTGSSLFSWYRGMVYPFRVMIGFLEIIIKSRK